MTTRARAAAVIALAFLVPAAPVAAAPAPIRIVSVSAENVAPGDTVRVRFRVTNTGSRAETAIVVVGGGLECRTGCRAEPNLAAGKSRDFEAKLVAPEVSAGEISGLNISAAVRLGGQNSFDHRTVYVHGSGSSAPGATKKPAKEVRRVSGRVRDADGKAVSGAAVTVQDRAEHRFRTTTNRSGRFTIRSSDARPIAAGRVTVVVAKDGYRTARETVTGSASALVVLTAVGTPAPPSPSASPAAVETADPGTSVAAPTFEPVSEEGGSSLPYSIFGGLLVAVGLGALAVVMLRRRNASAV